MSLFTSSRTAISRALDLSGKGRRSNHPKKCDSLTGEWQGDEDEGLPLPPSGWGRHKRALVVSACCLTPLLLGWLAISVVIPQFVRDGPAPFRPGCGVRTAAATAAFSDPHSPGVRPDSAAHHLARYHGPPVEFPDRFTLVINSYQRHVLLERSIAHYAKCTAVDAIRVVWCEDGLPPTRSEEPGLYSESKEVRFDVMPSPSLNSRFWPVEGLRTEAVLSIDDDVLAPCSETDRLFKVWQANRRNMVGFYPRLHVLNKDCSYKYLTGFGTLTWWGMYSMVLTKAAFLHRDYLEHYTNHMSKDIHAYVDTVRNCEDLAMQFLVANVTGEAPLFVHSSRVLDLGKGLFKVQGISSSINHNQERSACVNEFALRYGGTAPLKIRKLRDAPGSWLLRISPQLDAVYAVLMGHL